MKIKYTILTMALISFSLVASGQSLVFKVISSKGQTEIKRGNKWTPVTRGTKVLEGSRLRIKENGYLGLVHKSGKPIQLKKQGEYDVNTLSSKINVRSTGFASKYGNYIASRMSGGSSSRIGTNNTASVTREVLGNETISILVQKKDSKIRLSPTVVSWDTEVAGPYIVTVSNLFDEEVYKIETTEKKAEINLSGKEIEGGICIMRVKSKTDEAAVSERSLNIVNDTKATTINTELAEIERELDLNNALDNFFYATYFEDKELNLEALHYYQTAMNMEPDVEDYKKAYKEFLQRQGFKN